MWLILKKFNFVTMKTPSILIETNKALLKDEEAEDVDVHLYRSMIGSLMYLTASRPDIMFAVCACARDSPFDLEAFSNSDYARASLDRKSTTRGCQFLGKRLISWQCKKQTIVANSTTEAEYVAAANCCGQVLWIQNKMLDYGFIFMNTKIYIDNESTICIVKNPVFHSKTKHIEIRHHFIRDSYEKKLIQVINIYIDHNVANLLTKAFDVSSDEFGVSTAEPKLVLLVTVRDNTAEGFWATAKSKIVNDEKQIHATVDDKTVVILESSVRSVLHFNDEDGIACLSNDEIFENLAFMGNLDPTSKFFLMYPRFLQLFLNNQIALAEPFNDVYVTPVHTKKVFTNMKRQNKDFLGRVNLLFASMLVPQVVKVEGSVQPSEPQPPSLTAPPSHEEQVTTVVTQSQKTHTPRPAKRGRDTEIPQSSGPSKKVGDEAVYTGEDNRVVRAATTATSLVAEQESGNIHKTQSTSTLNEPFLQGTGSGSGPRCQDTTLGDADAQTRFETASKQSCDPPLSEVNTSGSGEDSMEHQDNLTDFVPPTPHVSPLLEGHTPGSNE
ncbi:hypothetical protein Tco_0559562, partial [Tanacetum coccineum]